MMSKKLFVFVVFFCACTATVINNHAPIPALEPITASEIHPKSLLSRMASEKEFEVNEENSDVRERELKLFDDALPETVLSVQYDKGLIKELYLSQNKRDSIESGGWKPSVFQKTQICEDLCQSGLGGDPCGYSCLEILPNDLKTQSQSSNTTPKKRTNRKIINHVETHTHRNENSKNEVTSAHPDSELNQTDSDTLIHDTLTSGNPRSEVCPILCNSGLGKPLCGCQKLSSIRTSWENVCESFCNYESPYQVKGCPRCRKTDVTIPKLTKDSGSSDFWIQWCKEQCWNGNGGAACNCDLAPMTIVI